MLASTKNDNEDCIPRWRSMHIRPILKYYLAGYAYRPT